MLNNLKTLREKKGVSQSTLAEAVGVSQQSINKYENHGTEPDIEILIKIAQYFSTSVDYLIGNTDINRVIEHVHPYDLNSDETAIIRKYRRLSIGEKESIKSVMLNYVKK